MSKNIILATIYKLVFKHNTNIAYVGQSTNINSRFKQHIKNANDFSNIDNKLYFFMNLYGIHNFYIEVIEIFNNISQIELNNNEKKYIQLYCSINTTYSNSNISIQILSTYIIHSCRFLQFYFNNLPCRFLQIFYKILDKDIKFTLYIITVLFKITLINSVDYL